MPKANLPSLQQPVLERGGLFAFSWMQYMHQLFARVGGDKNYSLGGLLTTSATTTGNVTTGEDDLISFSMDKNTLGADNDTLEILAFGTFANTANNKTLKLKLGSTTLFSSGAVAFQNQDWAIKSTIIRTGSATQKCITTLYTDYADITNIVDYVAGTENLATTLTVKCTGEATDTNDIVQQGLIVKMFPR